MYCTETKKPKKKSLFYLSMTRRKMSCIFFIKSWNLNSSTCPLYFFIVNLSRGTHIIYNSILFFGSKGGQISVLNIFGKGPYQQKVAISYLIVIIKFGFLKFQIPPLFHQKAEPHRFLQLRWPLSIDVLFLCPILQLYIILILIKFEATLTLLVRFQLIQHLQTIFNQRV